MRRSLLALLVGAALVLTACGGADPGGSADAGSAATGALALAQTAGSGDGAPAPGITVSGVGRVTGTPDTLTATVGVEVSRDTVQAALDDANAAAEKVIAAVQQAGVAKDDIQTRDFGIDPRYEQRAPEQPPVITGYTVRNLLEVKVRALDSAGAVLQAAAQAGGDATRVHGVTFSLEDNEALLESARKEAFADAKQKAEQYASLSGRGLGALVSVSETVASPPTPQPYLDTAGGSMARAAVPIQAGQQEVSVQVTAVWSMQ